MYASLSKLFLIEKEGEVGEKAEKESTELCLCFQMYQYSSCVFTDVTTAAGSCTLFDLFDFWGGGVCVCRCSVFVQSCFVQRKYLFCGRRHHC